MYRIKNWGEFQHYKDRNPPWIKLHFSILSSDDWVTLDDASRVLAIACMLIGSRKNGMIDGSEHGLEYIKRVAYLKKRPNLKPLISCGFLENASECKQVLADARPETETETETYKEETETEVGRATESRQQQKKQTDEEWLEGLKKNPAYVGIDIGVVWGKLLAWCEVKGKKPTRARLLNWLNREDKPMQANGKPKKSFLETMREREKQGEPRNV